MPKIKESKDGKKAKKSTVSKSNALARAPWKVESVWAPKLINVVASKIRMDDEDFKTYEFPIRELMEPRKHMGGTQFKELLDTVEALMSVPIKLRKSPNVVSIYNIFAKCTIDADKRTVSAMFHPDLKPHFLQLQGRFTQFVLEEFLKLRSVSSQILFEYLQSWNDGRREKEIPVDELFDVFDVDDKHRSTYKKNFADFRRLLERNLDRIKEKTSLRCTLTLVEDASKSGKTVAVKFHYERTALPQEPKSSPAMDARNKLAIMMSKSHECLEGKHRDKKCKNYQAQTREDAAKIRGIDLELCQFCIYEGAIYKERYFARVTPGQLSFADLLAANGNGTPQDDTQNPR